jgi:glucose-6-phosphate isomerase
VAADSLSDSLFSCPAYAYGAVSYALAQRGASINAVLPYAERLEYFAEWFAQLWAESLGKEGVGQTPARRSGRPTSTPSSSSIAPAPGTNW